MTTVINGDSPSITFSDSTTQTTAFTTNPTINNIKSQAATPLTFATDTTERMRIDSSGDLLVGTTASSGRLTVKTPTNTGSPGVTVLDGSNQVLFQLYQNGYFTTGAAGASPYNNTTGSAANVNINADGALLRSTSSLKYKKDVENATHGLAEVLQLRPVIYKGKSENDGDKVFGGLIAEEVDAIGLKEFVQYAEDGSPDALAYGHMVSLLAKAIQELKATVDAQAARIAALENPPVESATNE
jgi:hypothetical protein